MNKQKKSKGRDWPMDLPSQLYYWAKKSERERPG